MNIKEIESAIQQLLEKEVSELSVWLANCQAGLWDRQIASDLVRISHQEIYSSARPSFA